MCGTHVALVQVCDSYLSVARVWLVAAGSGMSPCSEMRLEDDEVLEDEQLTAYGPLTVLTLTSDTTTSITSAYNYSRARNTLSYDYRQHTLWKKQNSLASV